jgi:hypothetical protein
MTLYHRRLFVTAKLYHKTYDTACVSQILFVTAKLYHKTYDTACVSQILFVTETVSSETIHDTLLACQDRPYPWCQFNKHIAMFNDARMTTE